MSLTAQEIDRIANLARLELPPEEGQRMLDQINGFFSIVEAMRAVDTTGVEPLAAPHCHHSGSGAAFARRHRQ